MGLEETVLHSERNKLKTALIIKQGKGRLNSRLRKAQVSAALNGNSAMLIWLGKNLLGQRDKQEAEASELLTDFLRAMKDAAATAKAMRGEDDSGWEE